jgi:predicted transcriptional regulator
MSHQGGNIGGIPGILRIGNPETLCGTDDKDRSGDTRMETGRRPRGTLEQEVVAALAAADRPMTPAEVRDQLGTDLAYTTVMTVLARLSEKGLVTRERVGRAYAYTAIRDGAEVTARQMQKLLDAGDDRAAVLSRFVGTLTDEDERLLVDLLRHAEGDDQQ